MQEEDFTPPWQTPEPPRVIKEGLLTGKKALAEAPEIKGVPTGIEGLDDLFFLAVVKGKKVEKRPLGGIPLYSVLNVTGVSDTGKSVMVEQFGVFRASQGDRVIFVTVESPAHFTMASLRLRAAAMGLDIEAFDDRIILVDAASHVSLRENLPNLLATLAYAIRTYKARFTLVDSVTGLFEHREMMARGILRRLYGFLKQWYQTALLVSQKRGLI
ncbi:MAG: KaiC domain-containing protein, partial [Gammaproteobacteria bacterium]